jgi:hypothetical protein
VPEDIHQDALNIRALEKQRKPPLLTIQKRDLRQRLVALGWHGGYEWPDVTVLITLKPVDGRGVTSDVKII